uniref:Uncharacterized protein n=1 Tax=Geospiza parvula TaxID=87175 RepID=A0A8C3MS20_GEOPR
MPPNLTGYYRFVSQENMDNYLRALDINVVLRKLVCLLKPDKEIIHTGDHMVIRTITTLRDYVMDFDLGVQFEEDLGPVDGRKCQTTVSWEGDQLVCEQLGEKRNRGWRHWLEGDQLHLRMTAEDEVCVQVFQKKTAQGDWGRLPRRTFSVGTKLGTASGLQTKPSEGSQAIVFLPPRPEEASRLCVARPGYPRGAPGPCSRAGPGALGSRGQQSRRWDRPGPVPGCSQSCFQFPAPASLAPSSSPRPARPGSPPLRAPPGCTEMHVPCLPWAFLFFGVISSSPVPRGSPLFGEIRSPNYPKPYPNNNISSWDIQVPKGYVVKLTFKYFDLEPSESCFYDYVKIKADKKDLGRYCGRLGSTTGNHPGRKEFVSKGGKMHLEFHSDFSNEDNGTVIPYRGFLASYRAVDLDECDPNNAAESNERLQCQHFCHNYVGGYFCSCQIGYQLQSDQLSCKVECSSELFTEASGYVSSPEYPQPYP